MANAGQVQYIITATNSDFLKSLQQAAGALSDFVGDIKKAEATIDDSFSGSGSGLAKSIDAGASSATRSVASFAKTSMNYIADFNKSLLSIGWGTFEASAATATAAMAGLFGKGVSDTQFLESTQIQMIGLTHSVKEGNKAFGEAVKYYKNNPFQRFEVTSAVKSMIQFGVSTNDVARNLDILGKVSLTTGTSIDELAYIYSRTVAQGKITNNDLQMLLFKGVDIYNALAKQLGVSTDAVRELASEGKISMADFQKAFEATADATAMAMNEMTFARQADRFKGRISNMAAALMGYEATVEGLTVKQNGLYKSVVKLYKAFNDAMDSEIGKSLYASLERLGNTIASVLQKIFNFHEVIETLEDGTQKITMRSDIIDKALSTLSKTIDFLTDHAEYMIPILGTVLVLLGDLGSYLPGVGSIFNSLGSGVKGLFKAFKGMPAILEIVIGLLAAGAFEMIRNGKMTEILGRLSSAITRIGTALAPVVEKLTEFGSKVGEKLLTAGLNALCTVLEALAAVLEFIPTDVLVRLIEVGIGAVALGSAVKPMMNFANTVGVLVSALKGAGGISQGLSSIFNIFGQMKGGKGIEQAKKTIESVGGIAKTTQTAAQSLSKGMQVMNTINAGIKNLILLAVAIAALGFAMKIAYDAIPNDIGMLSAKLGIMAGVVAVMGTLAWAIGAVKIEQKSILMLAEIAVLIGGTGAAMGLAAMMIPDNIGLLAAKLGVMAAAIVGMGALAYVISLLKPDKFLEGLIVIAAIAVDIGLVGVALGICDAMIPNDVGKLYEKMGAMGVAVAGMGVLALAIGAFMVLTGGVGAVMLIAGLIAVAGIAAELIICAEAIHQISEKVPDDITRVNQKIDLINQVIQHMAEQNFGNLFSNIINMLDIAVLAEIAKRYAQIGIYLMMISSIELDEGRVISKVELITEVCTKISAVGSEDFAGKIKTVALNFIKAIDTAVIANIVDTYYDIATKLNEIQNVELNRDKIVEKVSLIMAIVQVVGETKSGSIIDSIQNTVKLFLKSVDTNTVGGMVNTYYDIAKKLEEIQNVTIDRDKVIEKIVLLSDVIKEVSGTKIISAVGKSVWDLLLECADLAVNANAVENAGKIIIVYGNVIDALNKIKDFKMDEADKTAIETKLQNLSDVIQVVIGTKGSGGFFGAIGDFFAGGTITSEELDKVQSILDKMSGIARSLNGMESIDSESCTKKVQAISSCIKEVGKIHETKNIANKEEVVRMSQSILNKLSEFQKALNIFPNDDGKIEQVIKTRDNVYQVGKINQVRDIANKEAIVAMSQSILHKLIEFQQVVNTFPEDDGKIEKVIKARDNVYQVGKINQVKDIANKEWIVKMSQSILHKLIEFTQVLNTFPTVKEETLLKMLSARTMVYELCSMRQDFGDLATKEWIVGMATSIAFKLHEFTNALDMIENKDRSGVVATLLNTLNQLLDGITTSISNKLVDIENIGVQISERLKVGILSKQGEITQTGIDLQSSLWNGIQSKMEDEYYQGQTLANKIVDGLNSVKPNIEKAGKEAQSSYWWGIQNRMEDEYWQGQALGQRFRQGLYDVDYANAGWWAVQGFIDGASNRGYAKNGVYNAGWKIANTFLNGLEARGEQGSPWKTTMKSGKWAVEGLIDGVESKKKQLTKSSANIASVVINTFNSIMKIKSPSKVMFKIGGYVGAGLAEGIQSQADAVKEAVEGLGNIINSSFDDLSQVSLDISGQGGQGSLGGVSNKNNTIVMNNNIYSEFDINKMGRDIMFNVSRV